MGNLKAYLNARRGGVEASGLDDLPLEADIRSAFRRQSQILSLADKRALGRRPTNALLSSPYRPIPDDQRAKGPRGV